MVSLFAQTSSGSEGAALFLPLLILAALAFIPANIAKKKGYSAGGFYVFGLCFFIIALIVALVIKDKTTATYALGGPTPVANPGISWTHTGVRYMSGYTVQNPFYGIWDRQQPGPPTARFPYTDHGKAEAFARFRELEPLGTSVAPATLPPPPSNAGGSGAWASGPTG